MTERFRLRAIRSSCEVGAFTIFPLALVTKGRVSSPWVLAPTSLVGCLSDVTLWLACLPTTRYRQGLEAAAPA